MWPAVVVLVDEGVDEVLELRDGGGLFGLGSEPLLQGLLEPFDFAAGGRVAGSGVLLDHVPGPKLDFEAVAASSASETCQAGCVDHAVVGQR